MLRTYRYMFAAAVFGLLAHFAPADAQNLEVVRVASPPVDVTGNLFYALDLGYFAKAGLDVKITQLTAGAPVVSAIAGGAADIGSANFVAISAAHLAGVPLVLVAPSGANSVKNPIDGIVVAKDSPIKSAKDLNGKTMMTSALQNILQVQADAWIDKNGGDWKSIKWVEAPPPQEGGAVATNRVDAATITETFLSTAIATGDVRLLTYTGAEISPLVVEGGYFCTTDYAKAHPDLIRKFSKAVLDAGQWANSHHDEATAIMAKYSKSSAKATGHAVYPESFKASDLQPLIDAAAKYGAIKASFKAADLVIPELR
jgi:NitT/TauT family transport system substrate-binding protein